MVSQANVRRRSHASGSAGPQSRRAASSRDRLLAAAAGEFAARGFDGAKVDRIARRARVNKAMLYYHFTNKAALYRAILVALFRALAESVADGRRRGGTAEDQIRRFIGAVAAEIAARPHFPAIWLREMAEGGRHLDPATVREIGAILGTLAGILADGRDAGAFKSVHPLVAQMGIVAPLLLFAASAPVRERFRDAVPGAVSVERDVVVAHVETATLAAIAAAPSHPSPLSRATPPSRPSRVSPRRRSS